MQSKFSPQELQAEEWLKKVTDDRLFAASILKHRDAPPSGVCFHAQQVAEKSFDAALHIEEFILNKIHAEK